MKCFLCGKDAVFTVTKNNKPICIDCITNYIWEKMGLDEKDNTIQCNICHNRFHKKDMEMIDGTYVCNDCIENKCTACHDCGRTILPYNTITTQSDHIICQPCFHANYCRCHDCDDVVRLDEAVIDNDENITLCESCFDEREESGKVNLHDHDYKPNPDFLGINSKEDDREKYLHVGIELEIQGDGYKDFIRDMNERFEDNHFYLKYDGSLNYSGVEIVSQPMTYNFINNTTAWQDIFNMMECNDMNNTYDCGLHFHLDKQYFTNEQIATIDFIVNTFDGYFSNIGGRDFGEYCQKADKDMDRWGRRNFDRYFAVNLENENTIELRFCKSTTDYNIFMQRVQMVFAIADFVKKYTLKDLDGKDDFDFKKLFDKFMNKMFSNKKER